MAIEWPEWWEWELELSAHLEERMAGRDFTEVDLRRMLEYAASISPSGVEGRWAIKTTHRRRSWKVIVEPDFDRHLLVVVTAYPLSEA
jgi:hypothetical protein